MIDYLLEASVCLICLYLFYWLVLSREKLLSLNRFYLLVSVIVSLALPLITVSLSMEVPEAGQVWRSSPLLSEVLPTTTGPAGNGFSLISIIYWIGFSMTLLMFLMKLKSIKSRIQKGEKEKTAGLTFIYVNSRQAFSFFHYVFINKGVKEGLSGASVIAHEKAHIKGLHSLDLILIELIKTLFWFNPVVYAYLKALKLQHEYIADAYVMGSKPEAYKRTLIRHSLDVQGFPISSAFTQPPIEKRIQMIQKHKASLMKKIKPTFALPLIALLFILISCTDRATPTPSDEITLSELKTAIDELKEILEEQNKGVTNFSSGLPSPSDVTGWLKDVKTNEPIINAKIWSLPSGKTTSPNAEGFYRLPSTPKDTVVTYKAIGYKSLDIARNDYIKTNNVKLESKR